MSRSYWLPIIALGGFLAVCGVVNAQTEPKSDGAEPGTAQSQNAPSQNLGPALSSIQDSIESIARAIESAQANPYAEVDQKRSDDDLKAQKKMARWAFWMFVSAAASVVLTGIGVFLIWKTMTYTGDTLKATARMLEEAEKTTTAAMNSTEVSKDTARRQLRAYLGLMPTPGAVPFQWSHERRLKGLHLDICNFGPTPAYNVSSATKAMILTDAEAQAMNWSDLDIKQMDQSLQPGRKRTIPINVTDPDSTVPQIVTQSRIDKLSNKEALLWVWGRVEYLDAFKEFRFTNFRYRADIINFRNSYLGICEEGNDSE